MLSSFIRSYLTKRRSASRSLRGNGGSLRVKGGTVRYRRAGGGAGTPLVVVHGGPGFPHNYLLSLEAIGEQRPVIFYDQLGCGESPCADDPSLWTVERFTQELRTIIESLAPEGAHVLGHSWGAVPLVEYALQPDTLIRSAIFASPSLSIPRWQADSQRLRALLGSETQSVLDAGEAQSDFSSAEYAGAVGRYYARFVYGEHRFQELVDAAAALRGEAPYLALWGPNELVINGTLRGYDASERLGGLTLPVLYTCGRWDEATPETAEYLAGRTLRSRLRVFELSAHHPHLSEPREYCRALEEFMKQAEADGE